MAATETRVASTRKSWQKTGSIFLSDIEATILNIIRANPGIHRTAVTRRYDELRGVYDAEHFNRVHYVGNVGRTIDRAAAAGFINRGPPYRIDLRQGGFTEAIPLYLTEKGAFVLEHTEPSPTLRVRRRADPLPLRAKTQCGSCAMPLDGEAHMLVLLANDPADTYEPGAYCKNCGSVVERITGAVIVKPWRT